MSGMSVSQWGRTQLQSRSNNGRGRQETGLRMEQGVHKLCICELTPHQADTVSFISRINYLLYHSHIPYSDVELAIYLQLVLQPSSSTQLPFFFFFFSTKLGQ